jgi:hypothetical protein
MVAGMALGAIVLFALASWRGLWLLWLTGYLLAAAALVTALLAAHGGAP